MKRQHLIVQILVISAALLTGTSSASVVYKYSSPNFDTFTAPTPYTNTMSVSGIVELSTALTPNSGGPVTPISFSVSDGINTITEANIALGGFNFSTDANSQIIEWSFVLQDSISPLTLGDQTAVIVASSTPPANIATIVTCDAVDPTTQECTSTITYQGSNQLAGSWSIVPLPPAIFLFGSGLLGLIGITRFKTAA